MTEPGDVVEVRPEAMVAGGDALARTGDGRVVFVTGALPDERVRAEVREQKRDYWRAVAVEVLDPSPHRVAPPCPGVAAGCGGCQWQHVAVDAQLALKVDVVRDALRRLGRIETPPLGPAVALPATGYRTSARFGVERADGRLGFRRFHGHDLVDPAPCLVIHPALADLVGRVRAPKATEVTLRTGARTGDRLVYATPSARGIDVPDGVVIADRQTKGHFVEEAAGRRWRISAPSFFQVRPDGADALGRLVGEWAGPGDGRAALDLYAGVGLFAGVLLDRGWRVAAVEAAKPAVTDARHNLSGAHVVRSRVEDYDPSPASLVVADPARSGLGRAGVAVVAAARPETVVLVSCDPAALGRDTLLLSEVGYVLEEAVPVDLFPHTFHIEVISRFRRQ